MNQLWAVHYAWLIPLLPLLGAAIAGFFGAKGLKGQSHWPIWLGVGGAAVISFSLLFGMLGLWHKGETNLVTSQFYYTWIKAGSFQVMASFFIDPLTAVMLCVVTGIGFFITVFSAGYMKGEEGYFRFFAYLGLFIFSMTCLVLGGNFVLLYLGWEGVGLCSYLLIGYYYERPSAVEAAKKAFLVNRIGDFGFGLGIMLIWKTFGTISYYGETTSTGVHDGALELARFFWASPNIDSPTMHALRIIPFLLMLGAFGKSAQFPLYVWLPDAMEGPTPVSALIHAATMVTAGVYMIVRCSTLFFGSHAAMITIACIGAFTALLSATIALRQFDLKKVFAYSTISQLGYMFVGVAVLAPVAGIFHLVTHAFFKALLFLSSGVVMHAMLGELDMRKMSGLKRVLPITRYMMLAGCLALAGFPFVSGFFSKDDIVGATFRANLFLGLVMLGTAFLTAYYTFRLYFRVFEGPLVTPPPPAPVMAAAHEDSSHGHDSAHDHAADDHGYDDSHGHDHAHEHDHEPLLMIFPLIVLAIGAILAGYLNWPWAALGKPSFADFLGKSPAFIDGYQMALAASGGAGDSLNTEGFGQPAAEAHESPFTWMMLVGGLVSIAGIYLAYYMHLKNRAASDELAIKLGPITRLLEAKYYVDEIYQAYIVEPLRTLGKILYGIDQYIVDLLVSIIGFIPQACGGMMKIFVQRGYLQGYAAAMLLGIAAILAFIFVKH